MPGLGVLGDFVCDELLMTETFERALSMLYKDIVIIWHNVELCGHFAEDALR